MSKKQAKGIALICGNTVMLYGFLFSLVAILQKVFPYEFIKFFVDDPEDQVDAKTAEEKKKEWEKEQKSNMKKQWCCYLGIAIPASILFAVLNKKIEKDHDLPLFKIVKK